MTAARLTEVENEIGEVYRYEYNATGEVIRETDFAGRTLRYDYDANGYCIRRVNGLGQATRYERDPLGRLLRKLTAAGTETIFEYDVYGDITRAANGEVETVFERDELGRVVREAQNNRAIASAYDARGLRTLRRTSTGHEALWDYDANGLFTGLRLPGNEAFLFTRDELGRETERRTGAGFVLRHEYDALDRITRQWAGTEARTNAADARLVAEITERRYQYDESGNPLRIDDARWGASEFAYDPDGRLAAARRARGTSEEFSYDPAGNMLRAARTGTTPTGPERLPFAVGQDQRSYEPGGRLRQAGRTTYEYDADGRTIAKHTDGAGAGRLTWRYEWTSEGQLAAMRTPTGSRWFYEYDAFGRRTQKRDQYGRGVEYVWDGATVAEEIRGEADAAVWLHEPGRFVPLAKQQGGRAYACVTDQIGTPRELVTADGRLAWAAQFSAWGEVEQAAARETECPIRFQGQWYDDESGLAYNFHRYYDPEAGRYSSPDPLGLASGLRAYNYVHNSMAWIDPLGLESCTSSTRIYRGMKPDADGNFVDSPLTGAPNASQKGARTPSSTAGNRNAVVDIEPVGPNQMVGPSHTGQAGVSASLKPLQTRPGVVNGGVAVGDLPEGLGAVNDHGQHVSIFPNKDMPMSSFQSLLNSIPWK